MSSMNERDVYEIEFNLGPAEERLNAFFARLDAAEGRIIGIFSRIETAAVGSLGKSAAELQKLSKIVEQSLDTIDKKAGRGRKPIVLVDKKDVDAAAESLKSVGDAVDKLADKVEEDADKISESLAAAFDAKTVLQDVSGSAVTQRLAPDLNAPTQVLAPLPAPPTVQSPRLSDTIADSGTQVYDAGPINEVVVAQERQVDVLKKTDEAAAAAEASYIRFLAAELKAAAGADQFAREQIAVFAASRKNAEGFVDSVKALDRLSDEQIQYAEQVATLKNNLKLLRDELNQENADREAIIGQIERQAAVLAALEAAQEKEAAQAGKAAELEKLGEEVRAKVYQDRLAKQQQLAQQQQQAEAQFKRIVRVFAEEGTALNALAQRYGVFTATVRGSGEATNQLEKELQDIIQASPRLRQVVAQLTNEIGEFKLNADPSTFKSPQTFLFNPDDIRKLGFALQRFGVNGVAAFGEIYAAIGPAGIAIGAFTLGVVALTKTIVSLGKEAVRVFQEILSKSIELARQRQTAAAQFRAYLGNAEAAELVLNRIDQISAKLGQDVSGLAQTFLPQVGSIEEFQKVADAAAALALLKPNKTIEDAAVALRELSAGDVTSLRRQFEIPSFVLDRIKEAIDKTGNLGDGIAVLNAYFEQTGRTVETLGNTLEFNLGRGQEILNTFGRDAGKEIVDSLNRNLDEALDLVESKEATLRGFAFGVGTIISEVIDKVGGFIKTIVENITDEDINKILDSIALAGRTLLAVLTGTADVAPDAATAVGVVSRSMEILFLKIAQLNLGVGAMIDLFKIFSELALSVVNPTLFALSGGVDDVRADIDSLLEKTKQFSDIRDYLLGGESNPYSGLADFNQSIQDYIDQISNTDDALVDAILSEKRDQALDDLSEKYKKYTDELGQLQQDLRDRQADLAVDVSRDIIDFLEEVAQKRVDLATDNKRKLEEIERDYNNDLEDAAREHGYDMDDIEIEAARRRAQQATEFADKRLKIEEDYQRKIAEIRRKYAFDLQEAARQNDAIQYLRLLRQREFDLNEARIKRDEDLGDVDKEVKKQNDENARRRQEDIEDAKRAYKRKLEELEIANEREIEEQNLKYKQEQKDLLLWEERQRQELVTSYKRKLDDLGLYWERRLRDVNAKFAEEFDIAKYWADKMLDLQNQALGPLLGGGTGKNINRTHTGIGDEAPTVGDTGTPQRNKPPSGSNPQGASAGYPQQTKDREYYLRETERLARELGREDIIANLQFLSTSQLIRAYQNLVRISERGVGRDTGGHLQANQPAIVGANGKKELFVPSTSGYVYPIEKLYRQPSAANTNNYTYDQKKIAVDLSVLDTQFLNREIAAAIRTQVAEIIKDVV